MLRRFFLVLVYWTTSTKSGLVSTGLICEISTGTSTYLISCFSTGTSTGISTALRLYYLFDLVVVIVLVDSILRLDNPCEKKIINSHRGWTHSFFLSHSPLISRYIQSFRLLHRPFNFSIDPIYILLSISL